MLRLIIVIAILAALIYFVMGDGGKKTIKDYKNFSREELGTSIENLICVLNQLLDGQIERI
jgi:hypothetical protein